MKKRILVDFDGVIHSYTSGWKGANIIPDSPIPGALDWLNRVSKHEGLEIVLWTSRMSPHNNESSPEETMEAIYEWFHKHGFDARHIPVTADKLPAHLLIDDRAFCFSGSYPSPEVLINFKPYRHGE